VPVNSIVFIVLGIVAILALLFRATIDISRNGIKISRHAKDNKSLLEHDVFARLSTIKERGVTLPIEHEKKRIVLEHFYRVKCSVFHDALVEYVSKKDWPSFLAMVYATIKKYNIMARTENVIIGNNVLRGVPDIVISTFDKFHEPHIRAVAEQIRSIQDSEFHRTKRAKLIAQLEALDIGFRLTEIDLIAASNELNCTLERTLEKLCRECNE
jgi:hypothetical protein